MIRLALCAGLVVVPLLLLASPGHATNAARVASARHAARVASPKRATLTAARADAGTVAPAWSLPLAAMAGYEATTTTTTTTTRPEPVVVPVVHRVPVTTTTTAPRPAPAPAAAPAPAPAPAHEEQGVASWYQAPAGTCASPDLPFGTVVTVTNLSSGASVQCTIEDREAQNPGRVIDMSEQTFSQLADPSVGVIQVSVRW